MRPTTLIQIIFLFILSTIHITAESQDQSPSGAQHSWQKLRQAPATVTVQLHIAPAQTSEQLRQLEQSALDIADPNHAQYREHLEPRELFSLYSPDPASSQSIIDWLADDGLVGELRGNLIECFASVAEAERLLNTTYFEYTDGIRQIIRADPYHIPSHLSNLVDFITPTTHFPKPNTRARDGSFRGRARHLADHLLAKRQHRTDPCSSSFVTPACTTKTYNVNYQASPNRTTFAIYGTEAATYHSSDTETFLRRYNPPAAAANAQFHVIGTGGPSDGSPGIGTTFETALDTQTSLGLAWPATAVLYDLGGVFGPSSSAGHTYDPFVQFLQDLLHNETVPSVVSFSESMPEDQMDPAYARRLCSMMAQIGMRGVSLLFSSGDNGPNGDQPSGRHDAVFEAEFPGSCPWVTSVGGTTNPLNETAATGETIGGIKLGYFASGRGFSNLFPRPSYQDEVVPPYIAQHVPAAYRNVSGFNAPGRGVPDVSALSTSLPVVVDGITFPMGGTSASTPLWAALIALLNDYEASRGRPLLGFLNPWLYGLRTDGSALRDIITGGNSAGECWFVAGCTLPETLGYEVVAGWDAVTGLGVPEFAGLMRSLG